MTLEELVNILENPDRVRIFKDDKEIYTGFLAVFTMGNGLTKTRDIYVRHKDENVKLMQTDLEIRHKKWEELNMMKPLEPNEAADLLFSDVELKVYYKIYI